MERLVSMTEDKVESGAVIRETNLSDFLSGAHFSTEEECITLDAIEHENQLLSVLIEQFLPGYEDQRF